MFSKYQANQYVIFHSREKTILTITCIIEYVFVNLMPRAVLNRETIRLEELQGSFLRPHTHSRPGRERRHLTTFN